MHNWRRYPSWNWLKKLTKKAVRNLVVCCGAIWQHREKPQYRCTTTVPQVHKGPKHILQNLLPVRHFGRTNLFIPSHIWQLLLVLYSIMWKKIVYRCTSTFLALNYCGGIFFKTLSYLYEIWCTNFSADFWTFRNFGPQFRNNSGAHLATKNANYLLHLKRKSLPEKVENRIDP